jgi:hypothetical protein
VYHFMVERYIGDAVDVLSADGTAVVGSVNSPA